MLYDKLIILFSLIRHKVTIWSTDDDETIYKQIVLRNKIANHCSKLIPSIKFSLVKRDKHEAASIIDKMSLLD